MYVPANFAETDPDRLFECVGAHSFATLVSVGAPQSASSGAPLASHLPLLSDRAAGPRGQLVGHMAKANPQWRSIDGQSVLAIFSGPHAYISPGWYHEANVVPTWNYVAVHVYGTARIEQEPTRLDEIVRAYVEFYEATMPQPWSIDSAEPDFIAGLLDSIVGFTIEIDRLEGKWKLGQNHTPQRRRSVVGGLRSLGGEDRDQIAKLMSETLAE